MSKQRDEFMEQRGLPYRIDNASQMLSSIATRGPKTAVVAQVDGLHHYIGYYYEDAVPSVVRNLSRIRKYRVVHYTIDGEK